MTEIAGTSKATFYRIILWYHDGTIENYHCDADNYEDALVQFHDVISYFSSGSFGKGMEFELVKVIEKG